MAHRWMTISDQAAHNRTSAKKNWRGTGEDVPDERVRWRVGAEPMGEARRLQATPDHVEGVIRAEHRRQHRDDQPEQDDGGADGERQEPASAARGLS